MATDSSEFKTFHETLISGRPDYKPWYFLLNKNEKDPLDGQTWKKDKNQLSFESAVKALDMGYNIGIAGTDKDGLVIIDVDDEKAFKDHIFIPTLTARSSSRMGRHHFYFTFDPKCKINIPLENKGELRSDWQYVVAPGSWANLTDSKDDHENVMKSKEQKYAEIPEKDKINVGKYTLEEIRIPAVITYDDVPQVFKDEKIKREIKEKAKENKPNKDYKTTTGSQKSALYDLNINDVITAIPDRGRHPSLFHDSHTGKNTSISDGLLHCWRHNVSHNAISSLAVLAGLMDCVDAGTGHQNSGAGSSDIDYNNGELIYNIWKYAKDNGYLPQSDPIPAIAVKWYGIKKGYCGGSDIKEGWRVPGIAYIKVLKDHGLFDEKKNETINVKTEDVIDDFEYIDYDSIKGNGNGTVRKIEIDFGETHFITKYCNYMKDVTDAYMEFHIGGALTLLSAAVNGMAELRLAQDVIKPNIQSFFIGDSTTSRKSTAINKCEAFLDSAELMKKGPGSYSPEGLTEFLSEYPKTVFIRDEVGGLLADYKKNYMSGIRDLDCMLFDGKTVPARKLRTKKGHKEEFEIVNPYIVKLYATTPDTFAATTDIVDLTSGYLYRFLYFTPIYQKTFMPLKMESKENIDLWVQVAGTLRKIRSEITEHYNFTKKPITFGIEQKALEFIQTEQELIEHSVIEANNGTLSSIVGRAVPYAFKLAMLLELGKTPISYTITLDSMVKGLELSMNYFVKNLKDLVDFIQADIKANQVDRVVSELKRNKGICTHSRLLQYSRLKSKEFRDCIDTLLESETIEVVKNKKDKKIIYRMVGTNLELNYKLDFEDWMKKQNSQNSHNSHLYSIHTSIDNTCEKREQELKNIKSNENIDKNARESAGVCKVFTCEYVNGVNSVNSVNEEIQLKLTKELLQYKKSNIPSYVNYVDPEQITIDFCNAYEKVWKPLASRVKEEVIRLNGIKWRVDMNIFKE